jgi:GNAT superfamily N-acetyltransferase
MKKPTALVRRPPSLELRAARFEDVADLLRLVGRAVAFGCRDHYDLRQRAAVYASYAEALFVDVLGPFETIAAEVAGHIVGFAQLDPSSGRLRALFVDADVQGRGVGRALLGGVEASAARRGCARLHGAMSLNAVPFYAHAGFSRCAGVEHLTSTGVSVPVVRMEKSLRA